MSYGVAISTVMEVLKGVVCALETQQTFSGRMCHHREAYETDIQTLDRLLNERRLPEGTKIDDLTTWEWAKLETVLDKYVDDCINKGFQRSPGVNRLMELQNKIRGRGEE
jgi:uncharacterized Fe-S cluster-containing MiaB family protein